MDATRFDLLVRLLGDHATRRRALGWGLASGLGALGSAIETTAKKKRKKKKKRRKKKPCVPDCSGKACGSDGCGTSCGPCEGGECQEPEGECLCPFSGECSPGVCCATGQTCLGSECITCPVGATPCDFTQVCGETAGGFPCTCTTTVEAGTACVGGLFEAYYCTDCESNADCEALFNLPGQAVCVGGLDCFCDSPLGTACAVKGCVDVETCDSTEDCESGTCANHRCQ